MKRTIPLILVVAVAAVAGGGWYFWQQNSTAVEATAAAQPSEPARQTRTVETQTAASTRRAEEATAAAAEPPPEPGRIELAQADLSAVEAAGFVEGRNYRRLTAATQPTGSSPDQVEVAEFFMHSCVHCYNLEPFVEAWLEEKPAYINFVRIPTTWDAYRKLHAQAYYAAEALGIVDEIMMPFFQEIHVAPTNYLDSVDKLAELFGRFGVERDDFESLIESFSINTKVNRAAELANRYRVDSTPTIIINGKYMTQTSMADPSGDPAKLFELIELLAAAEAGR